MADISARPYLHGAEPMLLVGREREQAILRDTLAAALAGRGSLVLIGGEAGIGKTALAEWLLAEAQESGALALVGRCYDLTETPPYGPWTDLFASLSAGRDSARLPAPLGDGEVAASQAALFAAVHDRLAALTAPQPVVLLLDDLHWADPASLDLLRALARHLAGLRLLLLAAYRADDLTRRHPLYALLPLLEREACAIRFDLHPLDESALRALVARYALRDPDGTRLVAWLVGRAEGNAFFIVQLLRALKDEGALRQAGDAWTLGDLAAVGLPAPLRQVLDTRLDRLGEEARHQLALAAVVGQEVPLVLWAAVAETDEDGLLDTVERAVEAHLLEALPAGDAVCFAHALVREALYEGLLPMRRRRVHRAAAEALSATPAPDPDAVAYHLRQAGDDRAAAWLTRAGERAQRAYAWLTAATRYEAALALLAADEALAGERGWLLVRLAHMRRLVDAPRSLAALDEAARLAAAGDDRALAAAVLEERGWLCYTLGDIRQSRAAFEAGAMAVEALPLNERRRLNRLATADGEDSDRNHYWGALVYNRGLFGPFAGAVELGERVVAQAPAPSSGRGLGASTAGAIGHAYCGLGLAHAMLGRPAEAARAFAEARAAYGLVEDRFLLGVVVEHELTLVALPYHPERVAARRALAAEVEGAFGRAMGVGMTVPRAFCVPLLLLEGAWAEARALAMAGRAAANLVLGRWHMMALLGLLAREQGEMELARAQVRDALPDGPATPPDALIWVHLDLQRLAAALARDAGDLPAARAWLAAHDGYLAWSGAVLWRAEGQLAWAAYHRAAGDLGAARVRAEAALAHATEPRQPLALLAAHRALGELATESRQHPEAAIHLETAISLAEVCEAPYERALTLLAIAELRATTGQPTEAQELLAEARAILEPLEARPALARVATLASRLAVSPSAPTTLPFGLTTREAEVLRLVAQGLTDAQAAERLYVSVNTVKTHLRSVYNKLDVPSRTAAARFATDHGLA